MRTYFFVTVGNLRGRCRRRGVAAESEPPSYSVSFFDTLSPLPMAGDSSACQKTYSNAPDSCIIEETGGCVWKSGEKTHAEKR